MHHRLDVCRCQRRRPLERLGQTFAVRGPRALEGIDQRQSDLALPQVASDRLAQGFLFPGVIQDVVNDLEGEPHLGAEQRERFRLIQRGPAQQRAGAAAGGHQDGRFRLDDLEIGVDVQLHLRADADLEHLSLTHPPDGVAQ